MSTLAKTVMAIKQAILYILRLSTRTEITRARYKIVPHENSTQRDDPVCFGMTEIWCLILMFSCVFLLHQILLVVVLPGQF